MESDNPIAETTRRILRDLADPQTINKAGDGWKAPAWSRARGGRADARLGARGPGRRRCRSRRRLCRAARGRALRASPCPWPRRCWRAGCSSRAGISSPQGRHDLRADARWRPTSRWPATARSAGALRSRAVRQGRQASGRARTPRRRPCRRPRRGLAGPHRRSDEGIGGDPLNVGAASKAARPVAVKNAPAGLDEQALLLMGAAVRSMQMAGALEAILDLAVAYANERVAFERPIAKFQAVQHNLARLAGEVGRRHRRRAASAADAIWPSAAYAFDEAVFLEVASAKIRVGEAATEGAGHRPPGARRHRLHPGAHAAPLHAPPVGLARRLRQRERLGGEARQPGRGQGRRRTVAHAGGAVRETTMATELTFDPIRLPPECDALRKEVRAFLAEEIDRRHFRSANIGGGIDGAFSAEFSRKVGAKGWIGMTWPKKYGGHERSFLERYVVTEEFRVANAPVRLHFVADRQSGPVHPQVRQRPREGRHPAAHLQGRGVLRHRHERAGLGLRPVRRQDQGHQDQGRLAHQRHQGLDQQRASRRLPDRPLPHLAADQGEPPPRADPVRGRHEDAGHHRQPRSTR